MSSRSFHVCIYISMSLPQRFFVFNSLDQLHRFTICDVTDGSVKKCASWQYLFSHFRHLLRWENCCCGEWSVHRTEIHCNGHLLLKSGNPSGGIHRRDTLEKDVCEGRESTISPNLAGWVMLLGQTTNHHPATVSRDAHMAQWQRGNFLPPVNTPSTLESFQETPGILWEGKKLVGLLCSAVLLHNSAGFGWGHLPVSGGAPPLCSTWGVGEDCPRLCDAASGILVSRGSNFSTMLHPPPRPPNHCRFLADCVPLLLRLGSCKLNMPL